MQKNADNPLFIWAVTDNKPGHRNQIEGLIGALEKYRSTTIHWVDIESQTNPLRSLLTARCTQDSKSPTLLIGAGHKTHLHLLTLRRCYGGRIILMMKPSLPLFLFDLCFIPRHDKPTASDKVIETIGAINRVTPTQEHQQNKGLILLGGESKHYKWNSGIVTHQLVSLIKNNLPIEWLIAGSRRTPDDAYRGVKNLLPHIKQIHPDDVTSDWLPQQMQQAGQIWITEDSVSMVYEALSSGAKTGILSLDSDKASRVTKEMSRLVKEKRVMTLKSMHKASNNTPLNEADRCAKLLLEKFEL